MPREDEEGLREDLRAANAAWAEATARHAAARRAFDATPSTDNAAALVSAEAAMTAASRRLLVAADALQRVRARRAAELP